MVSLLNGALSGGLTEPRGLIPYSVLSVLVLPFPVHSPPAWKVSFAPIFDDSHLRILGCRNDRSLHLLFLFMMFLSWLWQDLVEKTPTLPWDTRAASQIITKY